MRAEEGCVCACVWERETVLQVPRFCMYCLPEAKNPYTFTSAGWAKCVRRRRAEASFRMWLVRERERESDRESERATESARERQSERKSGRESERATWRARERHRE
jgi:hypothetical protein